jgi:catechol 2,3-dioxygenase-like lactoylglutathione lyase family enzyme
MENIPAMEINEFAQVALSVRDLAAAKEFYRDVLGMRFLFDTGTMAFFQCGAVRVMLGVSDKSSGCDETLLYFKVADIRSAHEVLRGKGVTIVQEPHLTARMKSHDLWIAFIKDPSGNTLGLMCEVARADAG